MYSVVLILAVHALVESTHVQMAFYGVCVFGALYFIRTHQPIDYQE